MIYATKAFLCRAMARLAHEEGLLLDVASGGELHVALSAGVPASACTFHGNNKSLDELRAGDHQPAFATSSSTASTSSTGSTSSTAGARRRPDVLLRITPGVHAHTHDYIATGQDDSKFGFNLDQRRRRASRRACPPVGVGATSSACTATSARTCSPPASSPAPPR